MNYTYPVDSLLTGNLAKSAEGNEYMLMLEQMEMLFVAFENKIRQYSKVELVYLRFCLQTYRKIENGANNFITKTYLKLLNQYLKMK